MTSDPREGTHERTGEVTVGAECEVVLTTSGAPAMRDLTTGELMHPVVGPLVESARLYVEPSRLAQRLFAEDSRPLVLLDVGLGAGSNAAAAHRLSEALPQTARRLAILSFERTLAPLTLALAPEHAAHFGFEGATREAALALVRAGGHESARSSWELCLGDLREQLARAPSACAEIVFWDPFSPRRDPALWSTSIFRELRRVCREGSTVHTYSGATSVRSALLLAGFAVGYGPAVGDQRKRTTIAASAAESLAEPLAPDWLATLSRSSAPFPSDAPADAFERIAAHFQFVGARE